MNNHERAKKAAERLQAFIDQFGNLLGSHVKDEMRRAIKALDATEPEPEPKARPAFLGDRLEWLDIAGQWKGPAEVTIHDFPEHLRHLDGAPVSRVVPMPREIKESQLLTLEELEDGKQYQGVTADGRVSGDVGADIFRSRPHWYTGYLPVPKIKRGE